jgi:DNA-binding response OmpR family regulator
VSSVLIEAGYQVIEARDGIEGVALALRERPDAVVCDVVMPEISGYQVCRFLKHDALGADTPIILVTATELSTRDRFWGLRSGADRFVPKELVTEKLVDELRALLRKVSSRPAAAGRQAGAGTEPLEPRLPARFATWRATCTTRTPVVMRWAGWWPILPAAAASPWRWGPGGHAGSG